MWSGRSEASACSGSETAASRFRECLVVAGVTAGILGSTVLAVRACRWMGWPPASGLVFEGRWYATSWAAFPWAEATAVLVLMAGAPLAVDFFAGSRRRPGGLAVDRRAIAFAAVGVAIGASWLFLRPAATPEDASGAGNHRSVLVAFWLVVALGEEITFRDYLQRNLGDRLGPWAAIPIASVAFALWHGWPQPWVLLGVRAAAGLVLGVLYFWSDRLLAPILCHWTANVATAV